MSSRNMAHIGIALVCFHAVLLQLIWMPLAASSRIWRDLDANESFSLTREDIERDFMRWVENVGSKNHVSSAKSENVISEADVGKVITVDKSGNGDFPTITAAVNSIPKRNSQPIIIKIGAGVFQEKIKITKNQAFIAFQGAGMGLTKITGHDTASGSGSTFKSSTVAVMGPNFVARDISFENSAPPPSPGELGKQAVAMQVSGDKAAFINCAFYGAQDTLYDHKGRHYFKNCYIQGSIDFIFGDGLSLYQGCELHAIQTSAGSLTAQSRKFPGENTGFSFVNCKVSGSGMVYLGRAWGAYSRVVFIYTYIDNIIFPAGWYNWGDPSREKTVFYGQYKCSGPGADESQRVAWSHELTAAQAAPFQSLSFIDGESWVPS